MTGLGVPDIATRALVHRLRVALKVPVYGVVDAHALWHAATAGLGLQVTLLVRHLRRRLVGAPAEGQRGLLDRLTVARCDVCARVVRLPQRLAW